ncbi:MAG TPA: BON domain-containing protein [Solirubrobacteraceae bacterium]|jgi:osmotically-inducible protein OsmY
MSRIATLLFGAAIGAAATHFLDPASGRRRRQQLREQAVSKASSGASHAASTAQHAAGKAKGAVANATPSVPGRHRVDDADDVTLARKVETEIFRDADAPKGDVSVDVQAGVAYLRGTVADEAWIAKLEDDAKKVDGIKGVNNLLHEPGKPAPAAEPRGAVQDRL